MATEKKTYQILLNRHAMYEFAVDAKSHEDACKILQRELRAGELKKARGGSYPVEEFWADPKDKGDEWAVMCSTPDPVETHSFVLAWDGVKVLESVFPPVLIKDLQKPAAGNKKKKAK